MTSIEIIQEVIRELEWHKKEDTMYEAETNLLLPDMEQVLKDLEELEKLKSIEKELGCPLEVVYKALYKGFYCDAFVIDKDRYIDYPEKWEQWRKEDNNKLKQIGHTKYLNFNPWYNTIYFEFGESYYMEVWLKDYKKTWWLRKDKEE